MGTNGNKWHKKGESGRARGYKCVIMVLSNNKKKRFEMSLYLLCKKEKEYETTETYCRWWKAKASRL